MPRVFGRLLKILLWGAFVVALLAAVGCGAGESTDSGATTKAAKADDDPVKPAITVPESAPPTHLVKKDLIKGSGRESKPGLETTVQYVGVGYESGEQFDASWDRGEPFTFKPGDREVIPGWDQGIVGMKVGGRRELIVPPNLAYGSAGTPPTIGPNETLIFVIDLVGVR